MANYIRITVSERRQIATLLKMTISITQIARRLGRPTSTISREIERNSIQGQYNAFCPPNKMDTNLALREHVIEHLKKGHSPEQISGRLKLKKKKFYICPESIYRYFYQHKEDKIYEFFPRKRNRRFSRTRKNMNKQPKKASIYSIENRPKHIEERKILGHWEGDTIRFNQEQKACVTTLVERVSRLVCLLKNENGVSKHVMDHIEQVLKASPKKVWKSITFDNGSEFKLFTSLAKTGCRIYFSHPYSPWERGSNENTNGRIRRTLGRSTNMNKITQEDLNTLAERLNNTPRKCLNYQTPIEVFKRRAKHTPCNGL